ncbi:Radical SAM superfamily enzyme, MoaA/NifB/PqqE/SkfB family [Allochromatium warmingii]|uniref:Radical SAM superfamily enzyme, MoaA/NifB/PqqE/SkfB family n=1 Tax=Allochromatium warmingii TaxID=61595 RepID=A0A1H3IW67_ALLWA|nr:radical SAM protein [Allochromatium warmingii]SDY31519.1 Radical SAM superfamily enzyme, MoaA/NifB/PqqE/SkfB family [Allochromatium warmingii]
MAHDALQRHRVKIEGFIDKTIQSSSASTVKIVQPEALDREVLDRCNRWFVIVTSMFFENEIEHTLLAKNFVKNIDYILYSELKRWNFEIDISGVCQLKCPTCPNGNFTGQGLTKNMMEFEQYRQILDKLIAEVDFFPDVQLYSWGEPLLNPALPDMVNYAVSRGISVGISSNLNDIRHLEKTIQAKPDWFRVSVSGIDDWYSQMHQGGCWKKVANNIDQLSKLRKIYHPEIIVEINYHLYKNNKNDIETVAQICKKNDFLFKVNAAYIDPLDMLIEYAEGQSLPESVAKTAQKLVFDINEVLRYCKTHKSNDCVRENTIVIHSDGTIRQCPHVFGSRYSLDKKIFDLSIQEVADLFMKRDICKRCKNIGLNNFYAHFLSYTDASVK